MKLRGKPSKKHARKKYARPIKVVVFQPEGCVSKDVDEMRKDRGALSKLLNDLLKVHFKKIIPKTV